MQDISSMTLAEACDEKSPEHVVEYVIDWCRHEADNISAEDEEGANDLRALAQRLDDVVER